MRLINDTMRDPVANIGYAHGIITAVDHQQNRISIESDGEVQTGIPAFYNCLSDKPSHAYALGDEVIVRKYQGEPVQIIGFKGDMWPCVKTPAFAFTNGYLAAEGDITPIPSAKFYDRYTPVDGEECEVSHTYYKNSSAAEPDDAFTTIEYDWTDTRWHRDTRFYYKDALVYRTYNNETFSNVFNGTRSNVFGRFIHPAAGWGCMVYQINTFYNWEPQVGGRVTFDFYIYTSTGIHARIASARCDVTGSASTAYGHTIKEVSCQAVSGTYTGDLMKTEITLASAGEYTSDGSTNTLPYGEEQKKIYAVTASTGGAPENSIYESVIGEGWYESALNIYIKKR